jgi:hypothetical protein
MKAKIVLGAMRETAMCKSEVGGRRARIIAGDHEEQWWWW